MILMYIIGWCFLGFCIMTVVVALQQDVTLDELPYIFGFGVIWPISLAIMIGMWCTSKPQGERIILHQFKFKRKPKVESDAK